MKPTLDGLPVEIYLEIISYLDKQPLVYLSRAVPRAPIPLDQLYPNICLTRREQIFQLYRHLRTAPDHAALVREFAFESWTADAEIFVNLMGLLPSVVRLTIFVGPDFLPEHMEKVFTQPRTDLCFVSLRFRPYVQRATYYHFLAGAYYDSTIHALSRWPLQDLPTLSIVQDPADPSLTPQGFAQPLVFHSLIPLADLSVSPLCRNLQHFRMRVPARQICRPLYGKPSAFPSLRLLDMSTSNVSTGDLELLLGHVPSIEMLVLDGCPIVSQRTDVQADVGEPFLQWMELGRALASVGVERAREREKQLKEWLDHHYRERFAEEEASSMAKKKGKRGRKGLATATFSLRAPSPKHKKDEEVTIPSSRIPPFRQKIRVLPSPPALCSLATSLPGGITPETYDAVRQEFEEGWASGITLLMNARYRLRTSFWNGVARIVRFADPGSAEWEEVREHGLQGLAGLVDVTHEDEFPLKVVVDEDTGGSARAGLDCPTLCLAGPARDAVHTEGCGHRMGWEIFKDNI